MTIFNHSVEHCQTLYARCRSTRVPDLRISRTPDGISLVTPLWDIESNDFAGLHVTMVDLQGRTMCCSWLGTILNTYCEIDGHVAFFVMPDTDVTFLLDGLSEYDAGDFSDDNVPPVMDSHGVWTYREPGERLRAPVSYRSVIRERVSGHDAR